jgi:hypothetical protein
MKAEIKGKNLVITIPFDETGTKSGSGKSLVHATTRGNAKTDVEVGGKPLTIGLNAYTSAA